MQADIYFRRYQVEPLVERILEALEDVTKRAVVAGSLRRGESQVHDIEVVAEPCSHEGTLFGDQVPEIEPIRGVVREWGRVTKNGDRFIQVRDIFEHEGLALDLFLVYPPAEWGTILTIRTGPAKFSQWAVTKLRRRGMRSEKGRVVDADGDTIPTPTEREFFRVAGIPWTEPEARGKGGLVYEQG